MGWPEDFLKNQKTSVVFKTRANPAINPYFNLKFKDENWYRKGILWNDDWYARDENGLPIFTDNKENAEDYYTIRHPYARGANDPKSGSLARLNDRYTSDRNGINITDRPWYRFNLSTYFDDNGNLTENGKSWFRQYRDNSKSDDPKSFLGDIESYIDRNFSTWNPITIDGTIYENPRQFVEHYTTDGKIAEAYNTNTGTFNYFINDNGEIENVTNPGLGWEPYDPNEDYTTYTLNANYPTVNFKRWKRSNPVTNNVLSSLKNITSPENLSKINANLQKIGSTINGEKQREVGGGGDKKVNPDGNRGPFNPTILDAMRLAADNLFNIRNTNKYKEALRPALENYSESYKQINGDYVAKQQAENAAASLRNRTPLTSNAQTQTASDLEAIAKGNQYIQQGQAKDAQTYWQTSEQAFQQSKENTLGWQNVANRNYASLVNYKNKLAELDYQANKDNMQNIDKFIAEQSKRLWDKYDLYDYKRMQAEELNNEAYDKYYGNAGDYELVKELTNKLDEALVKSQTGATQEEKNMYASQATALRRQLDQLSNKIAAQTYINRLRRYSPDGWNNTFNTLYGSKYNIGADNIINGFDSDYRKKLLEQEIDVDALEKLFGWNVATGRNGMKFQSGGSFGVSYTSAAGGGNPYLQSLLGRGSTSSKKKADYSSSDSSSDKDDNSKQKDKLLTGIADTLKGIDGLNSDVNVLYGELSRFFDLQQYNLNDDPMQFYSMYIKALNRVNQVKQSAKQFDNAYKAMEKSGSITSPAIDSNGYIYVGIPGTNQIDKVSPVEYLQNKNKYQLLRNNELLELRKNNADYAFADKYITEVAYNGTSMQEISKFIKEILGKVGTDQESRDMVVRQYGQNAVEGLQQLQYLVQNQFATGETAAVIANLKGALSELNLTTKSQLQQAEVGIKTIIAMMPANMRTMLMIQGDSVDSVEKLVAGYVFSGLDNSFDFKFKDSTTLDVNGNPTGSSKSGSSSSGSSNDPKESTASKWVHGYGEKTTFMITTGTDKGWVVTGNTLPLTDSSDHKIGQSTLADATKAFGGVLDLQHAFMGNQRISSLALSQILLETGDITMVALPVNADDGYNRPAFERLKKLSDADAQLKQMNIDITLKEQLSQEQKQKVNEVYKNLELPPLFNEDGSINQTKYAYFGLVKGMATGDTFEEGSEFTRDYLIKASSQERKQFEKAMQALGNKKFDIDDGWLGFGGDEVYRGTIFIPIRTNVINAQSGYGSTYSGTPQQNLSWDTAQQYTDELKSRGGAKKLGKTNFDIQ